MAVVQTTPPPPAGVVPPYRSASAWSVLALLVSLVALAGTLYLSLGMHLKACPLCLYQRTFVMAVVGILLIGIATGPKPAGLLGLLALAPAVGGLGVAAFHVSLEQTGKLECPAGVFGIGSAPLQSLAALAILVVFLLADAATSRRGVTLVSAILLGGLFTAGEIVSAPPGAKFKPEDYLHPPDVCRPPQAKS